MHLLGWFTGPTQLKKIDLSKIGAPETREGVMGVEPTRMGVPPHPPPTGIPKIALGDRVTGIPLPRPISGPGHMVGDRACPELRLMACSDISWSCARSCSVSACRAEMRAALAVALRLPRREGRGPLVVVGSVLRLVL